MSKQTRIILAISLLPVVVLVGTAKAETIQNLFANPVPIPASNISVIPATPPQPRAIAYPKNSFWDELAFCETRANWQDGGNFGGGLGIYNVGTFQKGIVGKGLMGTWERWGGEQFAPSPQQATREEQIIVANRIAVEGWKTVVDRGEVFAASKGVSRMLNYDKSPVGFGGWGALPCAGGTPPLFFYAEEHHNWVATQQFQMGQRGKMVRDLQGIVGVKQDGRYGKVTRRAHLKWLKANGLPIIGVPPVAR